MNATKTVTDLQRQGLELVTTAQHQILKLNQDIADAVKSVVTEMPAMPTLPGMSMVDFDASAVIDESFAITNEWLDAQRKFANELYDIWAPVEAKVEKKATKTKK